MNAVREAWNLKPNEFHDDPLWGVIQSNFRCRSPENFGQGTTCLLILINTPRESVIAGDPLHVSNY
ncbi:MAG: hypothetical protein CM1200mP28_04850 [Deltaproteobacteria bacterium]|nr:MAG: hypothetical protein CM1200mP28_04850 [Deltaproteobacteria bacterium]